MQVKDYHPKTSKEEGKEEDLTVLVSTSERYWHEFAECREGATIEEAEEKVEARSVWVVGSVELEAEKSEELHWEIVKGNKKRVNMDEVVEEQININ